MPVNFVLIQLDDFYMVKEAWNLHRIKFKKDVNVIYADVCKPGRNKFIYYPGHGLLLHQCRSIF